MQPLFLYFNELCLNMGAAQAVPNSGLSECASLFDEFFSVRADGFVAFPPNTWNENCGDVPLRVQLSRHLSKDQYRRLLTRVKQVSDAEIPLEREVFVSNERGLGLTLADLAGNLWGQGWAISVPVPGSAWLDHKVTAQRFALNDQAELEGPTTCDVDHLSRDVHVKHWQEDLRDWGATISPSSELAQLDGHPIVMYSAPLEHGPAHVHLLEGRGHHKTIAKYEIEQFCRYMGEPTWDVQMKEWVNSNREQLLRSWDRCQRGGHPYALE